MVPGNIRLWLVQRQSASLSAGSGGAAPPAQGASTADILSKLAEAFMATKTGQDIERIIKGGFCSKSDKLSPG
jgi:hypothetical protein